MISESETMSSADIAACFPSEHDSLLGTDVESRRRSSKPFYLTRSSLETRRKEQGGLAGWWARFGEGGTIFDAFLMEASQQVGNEVGFITNTGETITTPTLGIRKANTLVYLKPGQAVILGGLITERIVEDEKKVPLLGDIPVMGVLFRSKYERKELVSVLFFIRPRVLEGVDLHRDF